jgi:peroxiredoxin Q/BCP
MLAVGTQAPQFSLLDQDSATVTLADQAGKWVVTWWYPKASTPG